MYRGSSARLRDDFWEKMMNDPRGLTRRQTLLMGVGGLLAAGFSPRLALAANGEDPAAIITDIANDAFKLFGQLNGASNDWSSRRRWAKNVTSSRFATDFMGEKAGGVFLRRFSASKRRTYYTLIEDVVAEFLLDIFALYEPNTTFTVNRVRPNRSNTATIMETTVFTHGKNYNVKWTVVDDGGVSKIGDVSIFGLNLVSDFRSSIERAYRDDEDAGVIAMLQTRIRRSERKYPD
ncbi:MAG: ABC transporter substrate-binding protein [Alphaproteobacteria bacterium]|nr:ABC transporter substrate-binding protein [Alphaproteobacteria bacterium]